MELKLSSSNDRPVWETIAMLPGEAIGSGEKSLEALTSNDSPEVEALATAVKQGSKLLLLRATAPGIICHYCRQKNLKQKVHCSRCVKRFCGPCLQNRNGEQVEVEAEEGVKWVCPKCRGGCGPGCNNCCTCSPCRKSRGLTPTGQVVRLARELGFNNVHDYLIYCQTGESPETIAKRKESRGWTKAGGAICSFIRGEPPGKQEQAISWSNAGRANANGATVDFGNEPVPPMTEESEGTIVLSEDVKKPANQVEGIASRNDEGKKANNEQKDVRHRVSRKVVQKSMRGKSKLDQIIYGLLVPKDPEFCTTDQAGRDCLGSTIESIHKVKRNRQYRKISRITSSPIFPSHNLKDNSLTVNNVTPGFQIKLMQMTTKHRGHLHQAPKVPILSENQSTVQRVPDGHQYGRATPAAQIELKRPVSSLQAPSEMGVSGQLNTVDLNKKEPLQVRTPAEEYPVYGHFNQPQGAATSTPISASPEGLQAILMRHLERRKKMTIRSCSKSQKTPPAMPAKGKLVTESSAGKSGVGPRQSAIQSGFEYFSGNNTLTGFGSFRERETGFPTLRT